jgi:hypothetical protein
MSAHGGSRGWRDIPLDGNAAPLPPRFRHVVGELHSQQVIHARGTLKSIQKAAGLEKN